MKKKGKKKKKRIEIRKPHTRGKGHHELKSVLVQGPKSLRTRIRLALIPNIMADEDAILATMARQRGGKELLRDYGHQLGSVKVQAAQLRRELQEAAGIKGSRRTAEGRIGVAASWKALPIKKRHEIVAQWDERAAAWLSSYEAA